MPNDYDEDGNNIVPCPICMNVHCAGKEDGGKCPREDDYVRYIDICEALKRGYNSEYNKGKVVDDALINAMASEVDTIIATAVQKAREEERGRTTLSISDRVKMMMALVDINALKAKNGGYDWAHVSADVQVEIEKLEFEIRSLITSPNTPHHE